MVEDESTVAQLIVDVLREEGHSIEAVLDSQEGLTRLSRAHYDLVICDLRMPRLDGPAFYDALVSAGSPIQHKILFVTGDTLAPSTLEFLEPRGLPYLVKPFLVEELKLAVNGLLTANRKGVGRLRSNVPVKKSTCEDLTVMNVSKPTIYPSARDTLLGIADAALAQGLTREIQHFALHGHVAIASSLLQLRLLSSRGAPKVIFVDYELLESAPVGESLRQLAGSAPIILLAPLER